MSDMDINALQLILSNPFPYVGRDEEGVHFSLEDFPTIISFREAGVEALDDYVHVTVADGVPDEDNMTIGEQMQPVRTGLSPEEITARMEPVRTGLSPEEITARMEPVRTGLSPEEIAARMEPYGPLAEAPTDDDRLCCICLDDCHNGKKLGKLNCEHEFHYACITEWLLQTNSCPLCKRIALAGEE